VKLNYRKLYSSFVLLACYAVLGLAANAARADELDPTTPQPMPISCRAPKPAGQSGLRRPQGDGNVWTFTITTDPDDNVHWVEGPNWSYPGKGAGSDPSWGVWGGGDDEMWLSWSSPQIAAPFTVKVTGKITCGTGPGGGEPIDIEASWSGEVTSFDIFVRRMGTSDEFGKSATVAAGAVDSDEHQVEIEVRARDAAGNPVAGISIPVIRIKEGGRGLSEDPEVKVALPSMSSSVTDAQGLVHGTFTSGNWEETTVLELDVTDENKPKTDVVQVWSDISPDTEAWSYDGYFIINEPSPVSYNLAFENAQIPITGHDVRFETTSVAGWEWNEQAGENGSGDYLPRSYAFSDVDLTGWNKWKHLSTFDDYSSVGGSYSADQTIRDGYDQNNLLEFYVYNVGFDMVDYNVYD